MATLAAMAERPDSVTISLSRGDVTLAWSTRQALMRRLQHVQSTARIRSSFDAVGASRPVELNPGQRTALLLMLEAWSLDLDDDQPMPDGLVLLRNALISDLHDAEPSD